MIIKDGKQCARGILKNEIFPDMWYGCTGECAFKHGCPINTIKSSSKSSHPGKYSTHP